jgi:signal transduction histidine kinase
MRDAELRLLVVDDEAGMRMAVERALRSFSVELPEQDVRVTVAAEGAESGEEAVEMMETSPPDVILLDHKMRGMSGLDVLSWIADRDLDLITIMITAYASLETAVSATKKGAYDFLAKPFTPAQLKASVRNAVSHLLTARQARRLREERRRVRFQFISVLAHELKAPLGAIEGYLHILKDGTGTDDPAVFERVVDRSMVRLHGMRKLIMDILDLTRIESGEKRRELEEVDLVEVAESARETMEPDADSRDIDISVECDRPRIPVTGDRSELEIVLNNLVSNAVKYNRDGGSVTVRLDSADGTATIAVSDTGIGISEEDREKLFDEFSRIRNDKTRDILGSGLGLSIVKRITSMYDGKVSVESEPGRGSTFTVTIRSDMRGGETDDG